MNEPLSEFNQISRLQFPVKALENIWFSDDFKGEGKLFNLVILA